MSTVKAERVDRTERTEELSLTGKEINELLIKGFVSELKELEIGSIPLFTRANTKSCIVNPNIELTDINAYLKNKGANKVDSFVEFLTEYYSTGTSRLIKKYLPYPVNEKVHNLPVLSLIPGAENPKFIQFGY